MLTDLPRGDVTLVLTDIEGSTRLLRQLGADGYADALAEHRPMATRRKIGTDDGMHGLGEHRLKDITDPVALYQLGAEAGAADRAAILIGGAEQLVARTGGVLDVVESRLRNATAAAIERRIGSVALEIDLAKGRTLEPDRVFDLALTTLDETRPRQSL